MESGKNASLVFSIMIILAIGTGLGSCYLVQQAEQSSCTAFDNTDYSGGDLMTVYESYDGLLAFPDASLAECQAVCAAMKACHAYTYGSYRQCFLKGAQSTHKWSKVFSDGATSGTCS